MEAVPSAQPEAETEPGRFACPHYKRKCKFVVSVLYAAQLGDSCAARIPFRWRWRNILPTPLYLFLSFYLFLSTLYLSIYLFPSVSIYLCKWIFYSLCRVVYILILQILCTFSNISIPFGIIELYPYWLEPPSCCKAVLTFLDKLRIRILWTKIFVLCSLFEISWFVSFQSLVGNFCRPGSGSGFRLLNPEPWVPIQYASGSDTLFPSNTVYKVSWRYLRLANIANPGLWNSVRKRLWFFIYYIFYTKKQHTRLNVISKYKLYTLCIVLNRKLLIRIFGNLKRISLVEDWMNFLGVSYLKMSFILRFWRAGCSSGGLVGSPAA